MNEFVKRAMQNYGMLMKKWEISFNPYVSIEKHYFKDNRLSGKGADNS